MAVAAYGDFIVRPRRWTLALTIVCLVASTICHLYTVALIGGVIVHLFFFQRLPLKRFRRTFIATGLISLVICLPYLRALVVSYQVKGIKDLSPGDGWWFPLIGGHHLTAGYDWLPSASGQMPAIVKICHPITLLPHLAVWIGMLLVAMRILKWTIRRTALTTKDHLAALAFVTALCQCLLDGVEQVRHLAHYLNATWIVYLILAWYALDAVDAVAKKAHVILLIPLGAYLASMLIVLSFTIAKIHRDAGTTGGDYGTDLENQMKAVARIHQFSPDSPIELHYPHWRDFGWAKDALLELLPVQSEPLPMRKLVVRYRNAFPGDARIVVDDFPTSH
jgi:energy-coupling factor transporter transmembrane protein EcfT